MQGEEESLLKAHNEEEKEKREYEKEDVEKEKIKEDKEAKPSEEKTNSSPQSTNKPPSYARPPPSETRTHAPHHEKKSASKFNLSTFVLYSKYYINLDFYFRGGRIL